MEYVRLMHILVLGPLFIYMGMSKAYTLAGVMAVLIIMKWVWHTFSTKKISLEWTLFHIFVIGGLLIVYTTVKKKPTARFIRAMLIALGFGAIGYHFTRLIQKTCPR